MRHALILYSAGSPETTERECVRKYLENFLSDRNVIRINSFIWRPVLHTFILRSRPDRVAENYKKIFSAEGKNPFLSIADSLADKTAAAADSLNTDIFTVKNAFAYIKPSLAESVAACVSEGAEKITVLPLYPQYTDTTVKLPYLTLKKLQSEFTLCRMHFTAGYADHPLYIKALAESLQNAEYKAEEETLLLSFHGLPQSYIRLGDPYLKECRKTVTALSSELNVSPDELSVAYQSKIGPVSWLKPYTENAVGELIASGKRKITVMAPGFSFDCLETLYELDILLRHSFEFAGGESLKIVPCLNDSDAQISLILDLAQKASPIDSIILPSLEKRQEECTD